VEVRHHEVGVLVLVVAGTIASISPEKPPMVNRNRTPARTASAGSNDNEPFHNGRRPVEHLHARGHRDQHGGQHEEQLRRQRHAYREHVVRPDDERQERDGGDAYTIAS